MNPQPDWDLQQLEAIIEPGNSWQLITAGPGAGKSAVACQRVSYLVDEGIAPSRILMISFTRTAISEIRDRITSYASNRSAVSSVRISTIDSHAWSLRCGFDDEPFQVGTNDNSFELSIVRTLELFKSKQSGLLDFMGRLEHVVIDEAQDVIGIRADLIVALLKSLSADCGATILSDPAQAIYGFTSEGEDRKGPMPPLVDRIEKEISRTLKKVSLLNVHRLRGTGLSDLFTYTRKEIEREGDAEGLVARVQNSIRKYCGKDVGVTSFDKLAPLIAANSGASTLVLFRRRADVLFASSFCSNSGIEHRLRMSNLPFQVKPWIGWLFCEFEGDFINHEDFNRLWDERSLIAPGPFAREDKVETWRLLHRMVAGSRPGVINLEHLRLLCGRPRPPVEFCDAELGYSGPILGTIHASKGRESENVVLAMSRGYDQHASDTRDIESGRVEEGRVYYVGATRARKDLLVTESKSPPVGYLKSGRIFRVIGQTRAQLEIGRIGDVDPTSHLVPYNRLEAQRVLALAVGKTYPVECRVDPDNGYAWRTILSFKGSDGITQCIPVGAMGKQFEMDLNVLWGRVDPDCKYKPASSILNLYLVGVTTIGLSPNQAAESKAPFNVSRLALAPIIKGFPTVEFFFRGNKYNEKS